MSEKKSRSLLTWEPQPDGSCRMVFTMLLGVFHEGSGRFHLETAHPDTPMTRFVSPSFSAVKMTNIGPEKAEAILVSGLPDGLPDGYEVVPLPVPNKE